MNRVIDVSVLGVVGVLVTFLLVLIGVWFVAPRRQDTGNKPKTGTSLDRIFVDDIPVSWDEIPVLRNEIPVLRNDAFEIVDGFSSAVDRVNRDDGPLNKDSVLLSPGEIAVFDESGALLVWFPSPEAGPPYKLICRESVTVLTYDDMSGVTPRMRDNLRLMKGGKQNAADE